MKRLIAVLLMCLFLTGCYSYSPNISCERYLGTVRYAVSADDYNYTYINISGSVYLIEGQLTLNHEDIQAWYIPDTYYQLKIVVNNTERRYRILHTSKGYELN